MPWLNRKTRRGSHQAAKTPKRPSRRRPVLETLEARNMLTTTFYWVGTGNAPQWNNPANWTTSAAPGAQLAFEQGAANPNQSLPGANDNVLISGINSGKGIRLSGPVLGSNVVVKSLTDTAVIGSPIDLHGNNLTVASQIVIGFKRGDRGLPASPELDFSGTGTVAASNVSVGSPGTATLKMGANEFLNVSEGAL